MQVDCIPPEHSSPRRDQAPGSHCGSGV